MKIEKTQSGLLSATGLNQSEAEALSDAGFIFDRRSGAWVSPVNGFSLAAIVAACPPGALPPFVVDLKEELDRKQARINAERLSAAPEPVEPPPVKRPLFAHQVRAFNMALERMGTGGAFALFFEMGLGKTTTALAIAGALARRGSVRRVLVVCPGSVAVSWREDLAAVAGYPYACGLLFGTMQKRLKALQALSEEAGPDCVQVAVVNYEAVHRQPLLSALGGWRPDLIVADESQRIKTHNAAQSKAMHALGDRARYRLILSGTPVQNNGLDIYSQFRFLDPSVFGKSFYRFRDRYAVMGGFEGRQVIGIKNEQELLAKTHGAGLRVTKAEALDLPAQTFERRTVELEPKARRAYDSLRRDAVAELEAGTVSADTVLTRLLRLQQAAGGFMTTDAGDVVQISTAKLDALSDILDACPDKLVVFAIFRAELDAIAELLRKRGASFCQITGATPMADRPGIVSAFQDPNGPRVFLAQTAAAGLGITLTAAALTVFYSVGWNFADFSQSLSRTHRIGQMRPCHYITLTSERTVDAQVQKALAKKATNARALVDNWRAVFGE